MPAFTIDLGTTPRHRWDGVAAAMKGSFQEVRWILSGVLEYFHGVALDGGVDLQATILNSSLEAEEMVGTEYYQEMQGFAEALEEPFEFIWACNLIYHIS